MKQKDVKVGGSYQTKVGDELVEVIVLVARPDIRSGRNTTRFYVKRADNGNTLPKTRTAAALRPIAEG